MANISTLIDSFNDNSINSTLWDDNYWGGTIQETSQHMVLTPTNNTADAGVELSSKSSYSMTGDSCFLKVSQIANGTVNTEFILFKDANNTLSFFTESGTLYARKVVAGVYTNMASVAYNSTSTAYWRIRESGGTTYWDYGSDGSSWTNLTSASNPIEVTALYVYLSVYEWEAVNPAGSAIFDNFNIPANVTVSTNDISISLKTDVGSISQNHVIISNDISISTKEDNTTLSYNQTIDVDGFSMSQSISTTTIRLTQSPKRPTTYSKVSKNETDYTPITKNTTAMTSVSKNTTSYTKSSKDNTSYSKVSKNVTNYDK